MIFDLNRGDGRFIYNLWKTQLADRFMGSGLGVVWAFVNPLVMFALFTFVFGFVFNARLPGSDSTLAYSIWLICGYGPWLANSEAISSSANAIVGNAGLVKNTAFKTECLPIAASLTGLVQIFVTIPFLMVLQLLSGDGWQWSIIFLPLVIGMQFLFLAALGLVLAAITTFVRDVGVALPNVLLFLLFSTPIFYPIDIFPSPIQLVTQINPFYILATAYRSVMIDGDLTSLPPLILLGLFSVLLLWITLGMFRRIKGHFTYVL